MDKRKEFERRVILKQKQLGIELAPTYYGKHKGVDFEIRKEGGGFFWKIGSTKGGMIFKSEGEAIQGAKKAIENGVGKLSTNSGVNLAGAMKGTIRYFDSLKGEGAVRGEDGKSYFLHFTGIVGIDKNNHQWPTDKDKKRLSNIQGKSCTFTLYGNQAENCKIDGL
jgi:hypothetical protein